MIAKHISFRSLFASASVALIVGLATPAAAATSAERSACTPDVFRLCASEIPNVEGIKACLKKQRAKLSPACAAVFHPDAERSASR